MLKGGSNRPHGLTRGARTRFWGALHTAFAWLWIWTYSHASNPINAKQTLQEFSESLKSVRLIADSFGQFDRQQDSLFLFSVVHLISFGVTDCLVSLDSLGNLVRYAPINRERTY
jgi:hypothetical protein